MGIASSTGSFPFSFIKSSSERPSRNFMAYQKSFLPLPMR